MSAINDILQINSETKDAKQQLVNLLITNGIYGSTSESWESLINKIQQISPGDGGGGNDSLYSFIHGVNIGELELERRLLKTYNSVYTVHEETLNSSTYDALCVNIDINPSATTPGIVYYVISTKERIDFTSIDSIELTGRVYCPNGSSAIGIEYGAYDINITGTTGYGWDASVPNYIISSGKLCPNDQVNFQTFTLDTTSLTGNHYFAVTFGCYIPTNYSSNGSICNLNMDVTDITFKGEGLGSEGSNSSGGGLDIISATELPATGKENQICVITDNPVNQFMLTSNYNDKTTDSNIITLYTSNTASNDVTNGTLISITSGNLITNYYFSKACQGDNRLSSYIYQNNNWNLITQAYIALLEKGYYVNQSFHGGLAYDYYIKYSTAGNGIYSAGTQTRIYATFAKKINFTLYNTIKIKTHIDTTTSPAECYMYTDTTTYNTYGNSKKTSGYKSFSSTTTPTEITFDISNWTGEQYLAFEVNTAGRVFITDLYLY